MTKILIHPAGTSIKTKSGSIEATITQISIRHLFICYEISYFHLGDYKTAWLSENEFTVTDQSPSKIKVGFK